MKKGILRVTLAVMVVSLLGCQTTQEQNIRAALVDLQDAYVEQDLDKIMAVYSEDYTGQEGERKGQVREYLEGVMYQGYLSSTRVDIEDVEIEIEGDIATVAPVRYTGNWGQMDIKNTFKKEGSTWRVISGEEHY
jgi:ketosteroid isomerase-like protein